MDGTGRGMKRSRKGVSVVRDASSSSTAVDAEVSWRVGDQKFTFWPSTGSLRLTRYDAAGTPGAARTVPLRKLMVRDRQLHVVLGGVMTPVIDEATPPAAADGITRMYRAYVFDQHAAIGEVRQRLLAKKI